MNLRIAVAKPIGTVEVKLALGPRSTYLALGFDHAHHDTPRGTRQPRSHR